MLQPAWYLLPLAICRDDGDAAEHKANEHTSDVHSAVHSPKLYKGLMNRDSGAQFEVPLAVLHRSRVYVLLMCTLPVRHYYVTSTILYCGWSLCMAPCNLVGEACALM